MYTLSKALYNKYQIKILYFDLNNSTAGQNRVITKYNLEEIKIYFNK